ncbi:hypothetical protein J6590_074035, partial [Homalodisca vitripennis]
GLRARMLSAVSRRREGVTKKWDSEYKSDMNQCAHSTTYDTPVNERFNHINSTKGRLSGSTTKRVDLVTIFDVNSMFSRWGRQAGGGLLQLHKTGKK